MYTPSRAIGYSGQIGAMENRNERPMKVHGTYSTYLGKGVILQVVDGKFQVPLPCTIIGESQTCVRVRVGDGWDVDIFKEMVVAIESVDSTAAG
jgi:hypothetical protein